MKTTPSRLPANRLPYSIIAPAIALLLLFLLPPPIALAAEPRQSAPTPTAEADAGAARQPTGVVAVGKANIRSGPGTDAPIVAQAAQGESLTLLGENSAGTWMAVETAQAVKGWIRKDLVSVPAGVTLPAVDDQGLAFEPTLDATPSTPPAKAKESQPPTIAAIKEVLNAAFPGVAAVDAERSIVTDDYIQFNITAKVDRDLIAKAVANGMKLTAQEINIFKAWGSPTLNITAYSVQDSSGRWRTVYFVMSDQLAQQMATFTRQYVVDREAIEAMNPAPMRCADGRQEECAAALRFMADMFADEDPQLENIVLVALTGLPVQFMEKGIGLTPDELKVEVSGNSLDTFSGAISLPQKSSAHTLLAAYRESSLDWSNTLGLLTMNQLKKQAGMPLGVLGEDLVTAMSGREFAGALAAALGYLTGDQSIKFIRALLGYNRDYQPNYDIARYQKLATQMDWVTVSLPSVGESAGGTVIAYDQNGAELGRSKNGSLQFEINVLIDKMLYAPPTPSNYAITFVVVKDGQEIPVSRDELFRWFNVGAGRFAAQNLNK